MDDCLQAQANCCCGPGACSLCCGCLPPIKESTSTRGMYVLFLVLLTVICCMMLVPEIEDLLLEHMPRFNETCILLGAGSACRLLSGYIAVYRLCFALVAFHILLCFLTMCKSNSEGCRGGIHNGYWMAKFIILIAFCAGAFFIPSPEDFSWIWRYIGMAGAGIFIILQTILMVDFAFVVNAKWLLNARLGGCYWNVLIYLLAIVFYGGAVVGTVYLFFNYTAKEHCLTNIMFIGSNAGLCMLLSFLSMLPCIMKQSPNAGVLPASIITAYVMYLTWSAMSSEPPELVQIDINPNLRANQELIKIGSILQDPASNRYVKLYCRPTPKLFGGYTDSIAAYVGLVIMLVMVIYNCWSTSDESIRLGINPSSSVLNLDDLERIRCCRICCEKRSKLQSQGGQKVIYNECGQVVYSYSFFHFLLCAATLFVMVQLTNWFEPENANLNKFGFNWPSVWIKMATSWACIAVYVWMLFVPQCCPGRNLGRIHRRDVISDQSERNRMNQEIESSA